VLQDLKDPLELPELLNMLLDPLVPQEPPAALALREKKETPVQLDTMVLQVLKESRALMELPVDPDPLVREETMEHLALLVPLVILAQRENPEHMELKV